MPTRPSSGEGIPEPLYKKMLTISSKTFIARLPRLSPDELARVQAWTAQHCARGAVIPLDDVSYLIGQREAARTSKMTCRLMRAALRKCGVTPNARRWLELVDQDEFDAMLQRYAQKAEPVLAPDEDKVIQLPSRAVRRSASPSTETEDGTRLILVRPC